MIKRINLPPTQSYSNLLETLASTTTSLKSKLPSNIEKRKKVNNVNSSLHLSILTSPPRRCFLTSKVLPNAYLIKFTLAGPNPQQILIPTLLLHSRFEKKLSGKGAWIVCREDAVEVLYKKGSYKRLSSNCILPSNTSTKIHSQLARRISQEIIMLGERLKSESTFLDVEKLIKRECIISELSEVDWKDAVEKRDGGIERLEREGMKLELVISLAPPLSTSTSSTADTALCQFITSSTSTSPSPIPFYSLHSFLSSAILPPTSQSTIPIPLIEEIKTTLESTLSLYKRRTEGILLAGKGEEELEKKELVKQRTVEEISNYFAIYSNLPSTTRNISSLTLKDSVDEKEKEVAGDRTLPKNDVIPLLIALWRCTLWKGEGWESSSSSRKDS